MVMGEAKKDFAERCEVSAAPGMAIMCVLFGHISVGGALFLPHSFYGFETKLTLLLIVYTI